VLHAKEPAPAADTSEGPVPERNPGAPAVSR
jgi:hypothetical protein